MKKISLFLVFVLSFMLMPISIFAMESNVVIEGISKVSVEGSAEEKAEASIEGTSLNLNLLFHDVGDSVTYKLTVNNKDNKDYNLAIDSDDEYVSYLVENSVVKANGTTDVVITAKYSKQVPVDQKGKEISKVVKVKVSDEKGNVVSKVLSNPKTGQSMFLVLALLVGIILITVLVVRNKKVKALVLILSIMLLPFGVFALENLVLTINATYVIVDDGIVYTSDLVIHNSFTGIADKEIVLGEAIPNNITRYFTAKDAMDAWKNKTSDGNSRPFCLKLVLDNDVVVESYIVFDVTEEMVANNPGMVTGEYTLKVEKVFDEVSDMCVNGTDPCSSLQYNGNLGIIRGAFGNNYMKNWGDDDIYWSVSNLFVDPDSNGYISVGDNSGDDESNYYCHTSGNGIIGCYSANEGDH